MNSTRVYWSLEVPWTRKDAIKYSIPTFVIHSRTGGGKKTKNITITGMMTEYQRGATNFQQGEQLSAQICSDQRGRGCHCEFAGRWTSWCNGGRFAARFYSLFLNVRPKIPCLPNWWRDRHQISDYTVVLPQQIICWNALYPERV